MFSTVLGPLCRLFSWFFFFTWLKGDKVEITFDKDKLHRRSASIQEEILYRAGGGEQEEIDGEVLEPAGHTAPLYIIKLPQDRLLLLTILTNHHPPVAMLLWVEITCVSRLFLLVSPQPFPLSEI